jgi:hypothetical protein
MPIACCPESNCLKCKIIGHCEECDTTYVECLFRKEENPLLCLIHWLSDFPNVAYYHYLKTPDESEGLG